MAARAPSPIFTPKEGQYLAFIYAYTQVLGRPPAEADMQRHFKVTPPARRICARRGSDQRGSDQGRCDRQKRALCLHFESSASLR
jgi:hypothetical protein